MTKQVLEKIDQDALIVLKLNQSEQNLSELTMLSKVYQLTSCTVFNICKKIYIKNTISIFVFISVRSLCLLSVCVYISSAWYSTTHKYCHNVHCYVWNYLRFYPLLDRKSNTLSIMRSLINRPGRHDCWLNRSTLLCSLSIDHLPSTIKVQVLN